jgi:hypothetical protein
MERDLLRDKLEELKEEMTVDDMRFAAAWFKEECNRCGICEEPLEMEDGRAKNPYEVVDGTSGQTVLLLCDDCVENVFEHDQRPSEQSS